MVSQLNFVSTYYIEVLVLWWVVNQSSTFQSHTKFLHIQMSLYFWRCFFLCQFDMPGELWQQIARYYKNQLLFHKLQRHQYIWNWCTMVPELNFVSKNLLPQNHLMSLDIQISLYFKRCCFFSCQFVMLGEFLNVLSPNTCNGWQQIARYYENHYPFHKSIMHQYILDFRVMYDVASVKRRIKAPTACRF